jgi:hypothetical protein
MTKEHSPSGLHVCPCTTCQQHPHSSVAGEHRRINRLVAAADERIRRLLAGFLALKHGRGGVTLLATITGLDRNTVARGRYEMQRGHAKAAHRVRRPGAGRPRSEKKVRTSWGFCKNCSRTRRLATRPLA